MTEPIPCHKEKGTPGETANRLKSGDLGVLVPMDAGEKVSPKALIIHPEKCNGCGLCEFACSLFQTGEPVADRSRVRVLQWDREGIFIPVCCQHCADAPCKRACPKDAVFWDDGWGRIMIDYGRCVSCQTCVAACPYGAVRFDSARRMVFKCDFCGGNPQCVHFCEPKALEFGDADKLQSRIIRQAAMRIRRYWPL